MATNENLNLEDKDTLCIELFHNAVRGRKFDPDELTATKLFESTEGYYDGTVIHSIFTGFEMGVKAALELITNAE